MSVDEVDEGEFIQLRCFAKNLQLGTYFQAISHCVTTYRIPGPFIGRVAAEYPEVALDLTALFMARVEAANARQEELAALSVEQRLVLALTRRAKDSPDAMVTETKVELATAIHASREEVNRIISRLLDWRFVQRCLDSHGLVVPDPETLVQVSVR